MATEKDINRLARIEPNRWRSIAMQTTWHFRSLGVKPLPPAVVKAFGPTPTREAWKDICARVAKVRRGVRYVARKEVLTRRKVARRAYMKDYMKDYRAKQREASGASTE